MRKEEIKKLVISSHKNLVGWLKTQPASKWEEGPKGKWTEGQHIVHLVQSQKPLNKALKMPKLFLRYKFGLANRPPRTYAEVEQKYRTKLAAAPEDVVSPFSKNMPNTPASSKEEWMRTLKNEIHSFLKIIDKHSEKQLDKYVIPHPLLGRMLIREFVVWTAIHIEHHLSTLKEKYT